MSGNLKSEIRDLRQARRKEIQNPKRVPVRRPVPWVRSRSHVFSAGPHAYASVSMAPGKSGPVSFACPACRVLGPRKGEMQNAEGAGSRRGRLGLRAFDLFEISNFRLSQISNFKFQISALGVVALGIVLLAGCAARPQKLRVCPGKPTAEAALQALAARGAHAVGMRANGHGLLTYYRSDKKKTERHNLPLQLWFNPPADMYIQGSVGVDATAVRLGSNDQEFWLALRPKEISSYYLGEWKDVQSVQGFMMTPRMVLEALGIVREPGGVSNTALWSLQNKGPYDILTRRNEAGRIVKRVQIYSCDYVVHKIEYFDPHGKVVAVANLSDYKPVTGSFSVPTQIAIESLGPEKHKDSIRIDLTSPKVMAFNEKQRQRIFVPPRDVNRFEHVYHYEDGRWVAE
jgi:hypothetical protein